MKIALKTAAACAVLASLISCTAQEKIEGANGSEGLIYVVDDRTALCFATYNLGSNSGALTVVPCTKDVLRIIEIQNRKK